MKNVKELAKELCAREGKMQQVSIAQMSEIIGHISDLIIETGLPCTDFDTGKLCCYTGGVSMLLAKNGERRHGKIVEVGPRRSKKKAGR